MRSSSWLMRFWGTCPTTGVRCDRCDSPSPRLPGARREPKSALHVEPQHPPDTCCATIASVSASMASPYSAPRVRAGPRTHFLALGSRVAPKRPVRDHQAALAATPPTPYCRITGGLQPPHTTSRRLSRLSSLLSTDGRDGASPTATTRPRVADRHPHLRFRRRSRTSLASADRLPSRRVLGVTVTHPTHQGKLRLA